MQPPGSRERGEAVSFAADVIDEENGRPTAAIPYPLAVDSHVEPQLTIIEPTRGWQLVNLRELWRYRELLAFLTWRDIKVRYKQTVLGAAWALLQPLATMVVFSLFVGQLVNRDPAGPPYPIFVFAGLLPWTFFANAITAAGMSVVGNQNLVTKVYFPRLIVPVSAAGAGLVDFAIASGMLGVLMAWYGVVPGAGVLMAPLIVFFLVTAAVGAGVLLSALTVAYRDFRHAVPFLVQFGMFATPCIYLDSAAVVGPRGQAVLPFNPAYGLILNFRQAMLGGPFDWYALLVSAAVSLSLLVVGCLYFRRVERTFADVI
jgi:lipopolysaccharide transport system permease protein